MKAGFFHFTPASLGAFLMCSGLTLLSPSGISAYGEDAKATTTQMVLAETSGRAIESCSICVAAKRR